MFRATAVKLWLLMSMLSAAGCMQHAAPPGLDLSLTRATDQKSYVVALQPPTGPILVNRMHAWEISLRSASGEPVANARIDVDGGMPQHGHGFPTHPRVTQQLGGGRYLMEGMKFSMTGWWEIKLSIQSTLGADQVTFNTVISPPSASGNAERWSAEELAVLSSLRISELPGAPQDPSNAYENLPASIALGKRLFSDTRFSRNGAVSCATCHDPGKQFQDGRPLGQGVGTAGRRTMPVTSAAYSPWLFWDGRKDSLWAQALGPLEDGMEHGGNRTRYAHLMRAHYRGEYEAVFGAMSDLTKLPQDAGPLGSTAEKAAWNAMDEGARRDVSRIFANMGKAIAAYQKTLRYGASRLDRYIEGALSGDEQALQGLTPQERNGLRLFIGRGQCVTCHNGPLLTDQHFHNTGIAPRIAGKPDPGRAAATAKVRQDEFNCLGRYSDARPEQCQELRFMVADQPALEGAFKTPGLRNVALRPPYMHAGQIASIPEVLQHYAKAPAAALGHSELKPVPLTQKEMRDLVDFLASLSGPISENPPKR